MKVFSSRTQKIGELGEDIAVKYLIQKGFSILERNFTCRAGEVDIIATKNKKIHFFEVKSVKGDSFDKNAYNPFQNVSREKLRKFSNVVQMWLMKHPTVDIPWAIDGIGVYLNDREKKARVVYLENINI